MSDVEKIIAEGFAGVLVVRREMSEAQRTEIARVALSALRAAGYEVVKPEWEYGQQDDYGLSFAPSEVEAREMTARQNPKLNPRVLRRRKAGEWEPVKEENIGKVED